MLDALWITAVGSAVLFGAIGCLVGLTYVLTARWLFPKDERPPRRVRPRKRRRRQAAAATGDTELTVTPAAGVDTGEGERRRRAVALSVAIACAETTQTAFSIDAPSDWRLLHRAHRLAGSAVRRKARS